MKKIIIFISLLIGLNACSGGTQLPPQVCEIGGVVCTVSQTLCNNIPQIPPQVCEFLDLACLNLNVLCNSTPGTPEYEKALTSLTEVTKKLQKYNAEIKK